VPVGAVERWFSFPSTQGSRHIRCVPSLPSEKKQGSTGARRGLLVAFEGIDGAGKTTQAARLQALLTANGVDVLSTKEPTGGPWGRKIRQSATTGRLPPAQELEAFLEDRKEHVRDELLPALAAGQLVIVDRYYPSTVAYQGARGMDPLELLRQNAFAPTPDVCVVLDVEPRLGLSRVSRRGDVADLFEKEDALAAARSIFIDRALFRTTIPNFHVIDGTLDESALAARIAALVFAALGRPLPAGTRNTTSE
jgi:dTMP kinase